MKSKDIVTNANSEGLLIDYYGSGDRSFTEGLIARTPSAFNINKALDVIKNDPTVKAAITTLVDKVLQSGWRIEPINGKSRLKELEKKLEKSRFNLVLRKALFNLFLYNNTFIEIVKKGEELTDLNVLETTLTKVKAKDNGDIVSYVQQQGGRGDIEWLPDKIVHIKLSEIIASVWAEPLDVQSLYETVQLKDYIRQYLTWFFGTNQLRGLYVIKSGASQAKIKDFVSYLKASEKDKTKPVIIEGDAIYQKLNTFDEGESLMKLMDWCDSQILMVLQVPPIAVGMPDSSGRSNSVEQYQALNTRTLSIQRLLEDVFTFDLFTKIGYDLNRFKFGVLDETARTKVFENVQIMKNSMFSDEAITEYLQSQGIVFSTDKIFKDPVEEAEKMQEAIGESNDTVGTGNEGSIGNKNKDLMPSRMRQNPNQISKANTKTMVRNSEISLPDYSKFPYVIEDDNIHN
jgi:hypothetical protein